MEITIEFFQLPHSIHGATIQGERRFAQFIRRPTLGQIFPRVRHTRKDHFYVVCNTEDSPQKRRHTFGHELAHIFCGHFNSADPLTYHEKENAILHNGKPLPEVYSNDTVSEREADLKSWSYYQRFRNEFLQAEKTGGASITAQEGRL